MQRSESGQDGAISVGAVIGLALLALVAYLLLAALNGDSDYYGSVPVPSENAPVELPSGQTDFYLAVAGDPDELGDITVPEDLQVSIASAEGDDAPRADDRSGDTEKTDDGVTKRIGAFSPSEEGTYLVTVSTDAASPALSITFGLSPLGAVRERLKDVIDWLNGPNGIAVLAALGLLFLAPRISRAMKR